MLDRIIDIISNSNCQIIQLDLTQYKNELNSISLKRLQKALELNKSIRKIIWPKDISADTQQIDADLQKKFKTSIPGCFVINQYKNTPFFHQIIEKNADIYANTNKIAVVNVDAKTINYKQLNEQANQLAYHLSKVLNLPKGTVVGVLLNRSVNYIISMIACMKAGFVFVPIDTDSEKVSDDRLDHYLVQCNAKYVLTENGLVNRVNKLSTKPKLLFVADILCDENIINTSEAKDNPSVQIQPTDISYIYFSSGSTGDPKGIPIEYGGLLNRIAAHIDVLALTNSDNGAQYASVAFDASLMEITMMLAVGGCLTIVPNEYRLDVRKTGNFYKESNISVAIFVPSSLAVLNPADFKYLRVVLSTGEPVSATTIKRWREEGYSSGLRKFINGYGDTEGTIAWTLGECIDEVHIGEPIVGCHLYLLKKIKQEEINKFKKQTDLSQCIIEQKTPGNKIKYWLICQNINEEGEIWLAGNGLTPGYLNQELNKKAFVDHPVLGRLYRTYNVAKYDIKGQCQIVDRKGRRLKIHGQFVEPKEIDNAIEKYNSQKVAKAFVSKRVYVLPHNPEYKRYHLVAYVEPRNDQEIDIIELSKSLQSLPRYMVPARWVIMDKLPINNSGKIDRKKLSSDTSPYRMARFNKFTPPREGDTGYEEQIRDIWCRLLDLKENEISIYDDFFYLGGDSLLFMQMIDLLKEEFSNKDLKQFHTISASTLALNPTIAAISRFLRLDELRFDYIDYSLKRENGDKSPLILIPPITGDLGNAYSKFVEKIPADRPVIGLKYPGYQNILNMYDTVEEHARDCSDTIISFRNKNNISGPILLFGHSSGGIIAYEIAKILIAKKYKVYSFICDSIAPDFYKKADQNQIKKINDNLLERIIKLFSVNSTELKDTLHKSYESNSEYISNELDRLLPQLKRKHKLTLEFIKKVKLAEINYDQNPIEDMSNDSKIILLTADKTIEDIGGDNNLYWSNCINATVKYEADHDNILEKITADRSFHELLEEADNKILYTWNIPSLVPGYIPRVELTSEIKAFFSGKGFAKSVICALSGHSGCGKTMLAINIINASTQYLQRLYFNASSTHQLKTELLNFAKKQNLANISDKNIFHNIKLWLEEHPGGFLVLDNCNKEKLIDFIPSSGWHVLITTNLSNLKIHTIPINGMKEHEANKLLSVACINIDQSNRLAKLANYQPLYLRLVCAYLRSYQNEAQTKAHELIKNCEIKNLSQKQIIFEISKLAFSRFQTLNYQAMQLLHELAYFNGSKISHLLVKLLIASGDAIKENNQFLLITNFLKENDLLQEMGSESFYIHPELQELLKEEAEAKNIKTTNMVLLNAIDKQDSLNSQTEALSNIHLISICQKLISLYPFEKTERCYYEFCKQLKPHIKVLLNYAKSDNLYQVKMLRMLADSYQANGNHFKQICSIKKAKDMVESQHFNKLKNNYEGNIQKALVYKDFVLSRLSIAEQFRYINLLNDAKKIFESSFNTLSGSDEVAKIEVQLHYILTQMGVIQQRDKSIEYINYLLSILPWESFERAAVLQRVFSIFPKYKQDKVLQAACTIYENYDATHPDLPLIYKQLYIMQKSKGSGQTQFLEKAIDIAIEVSEFCHINIDILSIFTLLINDYYTTYADRNLQDIGVKIDKANNYVKFFKYLVKKLQNNLLHFTGNDSIKPLLPESLYQEEKLKYYEIKFHDHESVKINIYNQSFLEVIKNIQEYCFTILGMPPCEFVIVVLGSFSYGLAGKGSDFEYSVIILPTRDNIKRQFIDNYFQCYLPLFESFFKIAFANTGCHIDRGVSPHIKYDKTEKKYKIKGFYGTPDDILDRHCRLTSNNSNKEGTSKVSLYQLLNPQYLTGNQALYQNFLSNLHQRFQSYINHEPFYRAYAKEQLGLHSKEYTEAYKAYYEQLKSIDISLPLAGAEKQVYLTKVKKLIAHPLVFIVFDIALYSNLLFENGRMYSSIFDLISCLRSKLILSEQHCYALEATLCDVTIIRNKINNDNYNSVSLISDNKVLLRICDEVLSEFAKNNEQFINSKLSDEGSDEQYEEDYYDDRYEHSGSQSILERTSQRDSHRNTSPIEMKSDKPATLVYEIDFPSLSIYRRNEYSADNDQRQIATMQLSTPIKNVNTSLDQSTDSPSDISPSIIKKAGIEELIYDEDEFYSSDEDSYQEDDDDEIWSIDNDVTDKWEINDDDLHLKLKSHKKYQEQFESSAKQQFKGFKSKLKIIENNSVQSMTAKESLIKSQRMKVDVNNKKTTLKSKNYQKEKVKYFKKTKNSDDNLRIRVGRNRVKHISGNKYNPHKYICLFDDAPNDVEDIIFSNVNSSSTSKKSQQSMSSGISQSSDENNLNFIKFLFNDYTIDDTDITFSIIKSDNVIEILPESSGFNLSRSVSEDCLSLSDDSSENEKEALRSLIEESYYNGTINLNYKRIDDDTLCDILDILIYYSKPIKKLLLNSNYLTVAIVDKLLNFIEKSSIVELNLHDNYIAKHDLNYIEKALKQKVSKIKIITTVISILNNIKETKTALDLTHVDMTDEAAVYLTKRLLHDKQKFQHITMIRFGKNQVGNKGVQALLEMQKENTNILAIHWHHGSQASNKLHQEFVSITNQRRKLDDLNIKKPVKSETPKSTINIKLNKKAEQADLITNPLPRKQKLFSFQETKNIANSITHNNRNNTSASASSHSQLMLPYEEPNSDNYSGSSTKSNSSSDNQILRKTIADFWPNPSFLLKELQNEIAQVKSNMIMAKLSQNEPSYIEELFSHSNASVFKDAITLEVRRSNYLEYFIGNDFKLYLFNRSNRPNLNINNAAIPWDDFFFNLNHYIAGCKKLDLSNLTLYDNDIHFIADNLRTNTTLLYLNLSLSNLTMEGIEYLSSALLSNSTLLAIRFEKPTWYAWYNEAFFNSSALSAIKVSIYLNNYIRLCDIERRLSQVFNNFSEEKEMDLSNMMLCDDGAKLLAKYLIKLEGMIPNLNLENNSITKKGWQYIIFALLDHYTHKQKWPHLIFEQGNFDIDFPKDFISYTQFGYIYLFYRYCRHNFNNDLIGYGLIDSCSLMFSSHYDIGQKNLNWRRSNDTLSLVPQAEVLPVNYVGLSTLLHSLAENLVNPYPLYSEIKSSKYGSGLWGMPSLNIFSLSDITPETKFSPAELETHTFNQRLYQKNMRATFFYNTSGRKAEHQHRHAPTKPNTRTRKGY